MEIITTKGFRFPFFSERIDEFEYFYYAIKAGAVFKGYISDICGNGAFNIHISQYVYDGYRDPKKKKHTQSFVNAGLGKIYYRNSMRYEQDIEEEKEKTNLYLVVTIVFFVLLFTVGSISSSFARVLTLIFILLIIIELFKPMFKYNSDSDLKRQITERTLIEERKIKKDNEERERKEYERQQQDKRDNEERQRRMEEECRREYERQRQAEYERTHENSISLMKSLRKPDKYGNITCAKCCSIVTAKFGFCPRCGAKFKLDS